MQKLCRLKQGVDKKVKGFLDKELMQGYDPNNSMLNTHPIDHKENKENKEKKMLMIIK
ncbi:hypothetical protein [Borreliella lanei]|uniref:Uncharacterized protein n=1 Tax=Borreliella lanei TaxID=373540 RepID=A0A7W9ZBK5_9SPIR|nr:hypothetical protein [Borreliella lanei]MBB6208477.1 hypothetical protein [Borreliella lanei]